MPMTRSRTRRQSTLTFLAEQLLAVERESELLRRKPAGDVASQAEACAERLRSLEVRRLALVEAMRQFDPELDVGAIAGVAGSESAVSRAGGVVLPRR